MLGQERDWSGTLGSGERSSFVVLSGMGRTRDCFFLLDGVECANVGSGWGGAVAVGIWSVSLAPNLSRDPRTTRTHATHLDALCLCRLVSIPSSLVSCLSRLLPVLFCFFFLSCLVCVFPLSFRLCVGVCACLCLSVRLSVLVSACGFL